MILNESLRFADVDPTVKRAFLCPPDKMLIAPRVRLYKWTSRPLTDGSRITPWWSIVESTRLPSGMMAEGFLVAEERAARLGKSHRTFARARAAISDQFGNTMANLLLIEINQPVWGFAGQASGQREFADDRPDLRHVFLIGGANQVWVPNLTLEHVTPVPVIG
jgi:hypothetical protein